MKRRHFQVEHGGIVGADVDRIIELVRAGNSFETACEAAGVITHTADKWRKMGLEDLAIDEDTEYAKFALRLTQARALCRVEALEALRAQFATDWKAALAFLEKTDPQWCKKEFAPTVNAGPTYIINTGIPGKMNTKPYPKKNAVGSAN